MKKGLVDPIEQMACLCTFVQSDRNYRIALQRKKHYVILKLAHTLYERLIHNEIEYEEVMGYEKHIFNHVLDFLEFNSRCYAEMREYEDDKWEKKIERLRKIAKEAAGTLIEGCLPNAQLKHTFGLKKKLTSVERMVIHEDIPWLTTYAQWDICRDTTMVTMSSIMMGSCRRCGIAHATLRCKFCKMTRYCSKACWQAKLHTKEECAIVHQWAQSQLKGY